MFIRFRQSNTRLYVSLVEAKRKNGTVQQRHVAALGAVGVDLTVRERSQVWETLHDCIGRFGIDAEAAAKLMSAVQARLPYPTQEEIGAAELADAERDAAFWENMHGQTTKLIGDHERLIAHAQQKIAELDDDAKCEAASAEAAKQAAARLGNYRSGG